LAIGHPGQKWCAPPNVAQKLRHAIAKAPRQCPERAPPTQRKHMENASETRTTKPQRKLGHMLAIFKDLFAKLSPPLWLTIRKVKNTPAGDEPLIVNGHI